MSPLIALLIAAVFLFLAKTVAWLIQRQQGNGGIVDAIWAWALGSLAVGFAWAGDASPTARLLLALMGGAWGWRLGWYLWQRNWRSAEDWRYAKFRAEWGANAPSKMFWFYQFQNVFTLLLAASAFMPVAWGPAEPPSLPAIAAALLIMAVAVIGESVADAQLAAFKRDPANRRGVCDRGLWRHSRHPNYFFECVHWLAYLPLALHGPWWWCALLAPVVMWTLLLKISGIPLLEARMAETRPGYAEYARRTNLLIPGPRRD